MGPRPLGRGIAVPGLCDTLRAPASMGPRPLGRGIRPDEHHSAPRGRRLQWGHDLSVVESALSAASKPRRNPLQWGHDLSVVESGAAREQGLVVRQASMGPRPLGRGIRFASSRTSRRTRLQWGHDLSVVESHANLEHRTHGEPASMGPRPLGRGIDDQQVAGRGAGQASMGPRPLGRGISATGARHGEDLSSFNGATTSRSWNPAGGAARPGRLGLRFNGATTSRSWNRDVRRHDVGRNRASMGPRPLGRGISASSSTSSPASPRFNGATTSRSWNRLLRFAERVWPRASMGPRPLGRGIVNQDVAQMAASALQWGHDLSVVESAQRRARELRRHHASMGPRPLGRGIVSAGPVFASISWLQWGHDLSVVESDSCGSVAAAVRRFNGATTSRSWNLDPVQQLRTAPQASMGPRPLGRGISTPFPTRILAYFQDRLRAPSHDAAAPEVSNEASTTR